MLKKKRENIGIFSAPVYYIPHVVFLDQGWDKKTLSWAFTRKTEYACSRPFQDRLAGVKMGQR